MKIFSNEVYIFIYSTSIGYAMLGLRLHSRDEKSNLCNILRAVNYIELNSTKDILKLGCVVRELPSRAPRATSGQAGWQLIPRKGGVIQHLLTDAHCRARRYSVGVLPSGRRPRYPVLPPQLIS